MRFIRAAFLAVVATLAIFPDRPAASGGDPECGEGRRWWPPLEACVTLPVLRKQVEPEDLRGVSALGYGAILYVKVSATGTVGDVQVVKAPLTGEPTKAGEAALASLVQAVRRWRFAPGLGPDGTPVAMTVTLKVDLLPQD